jgi:hypothetical protein
MGNALPLNAGNFITRWQQSSAAERANYALFLSELCDYLDLPRPDPSQADEDANSYVIDKAVYFQNLDGSSTTNYIDLYKRDCFVLEAKQGSNPLSNSATPLASGKEPRRMKRGTAVRGTHGWDEAMLAARGQAERYAKALPVSEGWPPFLVVVDVGHSIELYADFSLTGKAYLPFPDPRTFRILHEQLELPEIKERLRAVWLDPLSLDPSRETAKVTREVAGKLAVLARNLELHHRPKQVAEFLTRCIFTSFAEDVKLLPERSWLNLLESLRDDVGNFPPMAEALWQTMNEGGFSPILRAHILKFNGGLFESTKALPLTRDQLGLLIEAADSRWRDVEPAIFGTLLERALDVDERHALGAHYTPRAYVERLVIPTLVEPLRDDWRSSQAVITEQVNAGDREAAIETARAFHRQLCSTRVLDPACGSGTQTSLTYATSQITDACDQLVQATVIAPGYSQARVAVALALMRQNSGSDTTIYVGDPDPQPIFTFIPTGELVEIIQRSHFLRTALFTNDVELATHLRSRNVGIPNRLEMRHVQGNTYLGSSMVLRSEISTLSVFVGLDITIRRALLHDELVELRSSTSAVIQTPGDPTNRMTIIQSDGVCLDLIKGGVQQ